MALHFGKIIVIQYVIGPVLEWVRDYNFGSALDAHKVCVYLLFLEKNKEIFYYMIMTVMSIREVT